jgi:hypothetical protein
MMKAPGVGLIALLATTAAPLAGAHHSYAGFEVDERHVLSGTLTDIEWGNPHIILHVSDGTRTTRVEWMTLTGAEKTGVTREQFSPGERIVVTASRNRDPEIAVMAIVKEVELPDDAWRWPSGGTTTP